MAGYTDGPDVGGKRGGGVQAEVQVCGLSQGAMVALVPEKRMLKESQCQLLDGRPDGCWGGGWGAGCLFDGVVSLGCVSTLRAGECALHLCFG